MESLQKTTNGVKLIAVEISALGAMIWMHWLQWVKSLQNVKSYAGAIDGANAGGTEYVY